MKTTTSFIIIVLTFLLFGCKEKQISYTAEIHEIASDANLWTGLAMSKDGRLFVNYPRWAPNIPMSAGEIKEGRIYPYPDRNMNYFTADSVSLDHFSCVQSVFIDDKNDLWILDPANPFFAGVVETGPRLYQFNLENNKLIKAYTFNNSSFDNRCKASLGG